MSRSGPLPPHAAPQPKAPPYRAPGGNAISGLTFNRRFGVILGGILALAASSVAAVLFLQQKTRADGSQVRRRATGKYQLPRNALGISRRPLSHLLGDRTRRQAHAVAASVGCAARHRDPGYGRRIGAILVARQPGDRVLQRQVPQEGEDRGRRSGRHLRNRSLARRRVVEPGWHHSVRAGLLRRLVPCGGERRQAATGARAERIQIGTGRPVAAVPARRQTLRVLPADGFGRDLRRLRRLAGTGGLQAPLHQPDQRRLLGGIAGFTEVRLPAVHQRAHPDGAAVQRGPPRNRPGPDRAGERYRGRAQPGAGADFGFHHRRAGLSERGTIHPPDGVDGSRRQADCDRRRTGRLGSAEDLAGWTPRGGSQDRKRTV